MNHLDEYKDFGIKLARKAGIIMRKYFFATDQGLQYKSDNSPVTNADTEVNEIIIKEIEKVFPNHGVLAEERSTLNDTHKDVWVCDPVDGTKAFIWGVPTAMFSLAYVKDGEALVGIVYDPFLDRMYTAVKGKKAFCNDLPLKVSSNHLSGSLFGGGSSSRQFQKWQAFYEHLEANGVHVMWFSGAVYKMMLVASGKSIGYVEEQINTHDFAAAKVIVEEAGGKVTLLDGTEPRLDRLNKGALITNGVVHKEILELISQI